jgi:nicotinamide-nucleotide adenylyltransferase
MASRIANLTTLRSIFGQKVKEFAAANSTFTVVHSQDSGEVRTGPLFVLDSSFNPPTKAHLRIAISALRSRPGPKRLLLLLATQNADKPAKPAAIDERLTMMTLLGEAVREEMQQNPPDVDIGLTKMPYFHDKASSIDRDSRYAYPKDGENVDAEQIYLIGFDSLVRIFDRKYYPPEKGFSSLDPFLKHRLRVTMRPDDQWGNRASQERFVDDIRAGRRAVEGIKRQWGERIELVEGKKEGEEVVSSTQARQAAKQKDSDMLGRMVIPSIKEWIETEALYKDE